MKKLLFLSGLLSAALSAWAQKPVERLYVGTYSVRGSEGIYVFDFDRQNGTLTPVQSVANTKSPSFLAFHPSGRYLYAVGEGASEGPDKLGQVSAYTVDAATGKLTFLNHESSLGRGPCYVSTDHTGQLAFVANYGGGSMAVLPIQANGRLGTPTDSLQSYGRGANPNRQERAHIHSTNVSPDNRYLYVADLGLDRVYIRAINPNKHTAKAAATPYATVAPGSGPRHMAFHPNGKFVYLAEELTSSVAVFSRNAQTGELKLLHDRVKTLPDTFTGENTSADIHIDPSGKFLYQSNRGYNALTIFAIAADGSLKKVGDAPTEGQTPRNFMIDPKGEFVLVANQATDNITIFRRNAATGLLTYTGTSVRVPSPVCLLMR